MAIGVESRLSQLLPLCRIPPGSLRICWQSTVTRWFFLHSTLECWQWSNSGLFYCWSSSWALWNPVEALPAHFFSMYPCTSAQCQFTFHQTLAHILTTASEFSVLLVPPMICPLLGFWAHLQYVLHSRQTLDGWHYCPTVQTKLCLKYSRCSSNPHWIYLNLCSILDVCLSTTFEY